MFKVENLSFKLSERMLFSQLSFSLKDGERLAILGPNGAGKSSLLALLSGSLTPQTGGVFYHGSIVHHEDRRLSFARQFSGYPYYMRVSELLHIFQLSTPKVNQEKVQDLYNYLLRCMKSYYHNLSGGEAKLVSNYIVMSMDSQCLLLDEPTSSLDVAASDLMNSLLRTDQRTLIFSSHDLREALKITKQVLFLTGRQAYYFDLRSSDYFSLYERHRPSKHHNFLPHRYFQIAKNSYLLLDEEDDEPDPSWQRRGKFSASLALYQIFNLLKSREEEEHEI